MAPLKQKGDTAELAVALDIRRRGYPVCFPFGEDCDYDLVVDRGDRLERVQVKYTESDGAVIHVRCRAISVTNGKVVNTKCYTANEIDWLAIFDATTERCYYVPASHLGAGRHMMHLRLMPARSGRKQGINWAEDFLRF